MRRTIFSIQAAQKPLGLKLTAILALVILAFSTNLSPIKAASSNQLPFSARLTTTSGNNVADGTYSVIFRLYTTATAGAAIWTETQNVQVLRGNFSSYLGAVTPLTGVDFNSSSIYLSFQVGSDPEMTPRYQIGSVPSALNANALDGKSSTAYFQKDQNETVTGNTTFTGNLNIQPSATSGTALLINTGNGYTGNLLGLQVNGANKLSVDQSGNVTSSGTISASGNVTTSGNLLAGGTLQVSGTSTFSGGVTIANGETVTGGVAVTGGAAITGNSSVTGALTVSQALSADHLVVTNGIVASTGAFSGALNAASGTVSGALNTGSISNTGTLATGSTNITGNLNVSGTITSAGTTQTGQYTNSFAPTDPNAAWAIAAQGAPLASINSGLLAVGNGGFTGLANSFVGSTNGTVIAANATGSFAGNLLDLQVGGASKFSASATGAVTTASTLTVTSGGLVAQNGGLTATGNSSITGTLGVSSNLTAGALASSSTLTVTGNTTLGGTLGVSGALAGTTGSFSGSLASGSSAISGNQTVGGSETITGGLSAASLNTGGNLVANISSLGATSVAGNLTVTGSITGSVADTNLTANVALLSRSSQTFTGTNAFNGISNTGMLTSTGTINGASLTGGSLSSTAVNGLALSGGVISAGSWQGSSVGVQYGGTGLNSIATGQLIYGSAANTYSKLNTPAANGQCLTSSSGVPTWSSCSVAAGGTPSLQAVYGQGNTIALTDASDLAISLTDTTTDPNFTVNIASGSSGRFAVQNAGADIFAVSSAGTIIQGATVNGGFTANNGQTLTGGTNVTQGLTVAGGINNSTGGITNAGALSGITTLAATGNATIFGTLSGLTGLTVASGGAAITGNSSITGNLAVTGAITGSIGDSNLTSNVALLNRAGQTFTGTDSFSNSLTTNGISNTGQVATNSLIVSGTPTASSSTSLVQFGSAISGGNASGTYLGLNASGYSGDLLNLQANGNSVVRIGLDGTTAIGQIASANTQSVALGYNSVADGSGAVSIGAISHAVGDGSLALGNGSTSNGAYSTALGPSNAFGFLSSAIGGGFANGDFSTAIGDFTSAQGKSSYALGINVTSTGAYSTVFGSGAYSGGGSLVNNLQGSLSFGHNSTLSTLSVRGGGSYNNQTCNDDVFGGSCGDNGSLSVTSGSKNIVGSGTSFTGNFTPGDQILINGSNEFYTVESIADDTHLTLTSPVVTSESAVAYDVIPSLLTLSTNSGTAALFASDQGNIGIGTTNPAYALDVVGNINASVAIKVGGNTVCTSIGCTAAAGSGSYIQNQTATAQSAGFNISGNGSIGGNETVGGTINGATLSGGSLSSTAVNGLNVASGVISNGTINGTSSYLGQTIAVGYGGTGNATFTGNGILYGNGANSLQVTAAGTSGQLLLANASGVPTFVSLSGDATVAANGALTLKNSGVTAQSYGSSNQVPTFTVDAQGRITLASTTTISGTAPGGAAGGDLSGTYPNPTVAKINGTLLGTTASTIGTLLMGTGANVASVALSGDATIGGTGVLTVQPGAITGGKIATGTITAANLAAGDFSSKITSGTYSINISGNAATVTNGVYTNTANTIIPASGVALSLKPSGTNHTLDLYNAGGIASYFDANGLFNGSGGGLSAGTIANGSLANSSVTVAAGTGLSGGGTVALGGTTTLTNTGVLSVTGTANQVVTSGSTGNISLSLPQSIATTSSPTFAGLTVSGNQSVSGNLTVGGTITGTVGDSNLSSNVALLNRPNQAFTGSNTFSATGTGLAVTNNATVGGTLVVTGLINGSTISGGSLSATTVNGLSVASGTISGGTFTNGAITGTSTFQGSTISVAYGGTGIASATANGLLYGNGTSALQVTAAGTSGQLLLSNSSGVPTFATVSGDATLAATGVLSLKNSGVSAASYGSATQVPTFTVDPQGRLTAASSVTISGTTPGGTAGGDLSGTYPNPTVAKINGTALGLTNANAGSLLMGNGTTIASLALTGDATVSGTGVLTVANSAISSAKILDGTIVAADLAAGNFSSAITSGTYSINISGNATTVSNGVYTNAANTITAPSAGAIPLTLKPGSIGDALDIYNSSSALASSFDRNGLFNGSGAGITSGTIATSSLANNSLTVTAGTGLAGGGVVALGGSVTISNAGVTGLTGTANQVSVSGATGNVTLSLPQSIATASSPTFANETLSGTLNGATISGGSLSSTSVNGLNVASGVISNGTINGTSSYQGQTIAVGYGGTGAATFTSNGLLYGNGTSALQVTSAGTSGQLLLANSSGVPAFVTLSGDATVAATGALTLKNSGVTAQSYGSSTQVPTFTVDAQGRITLASTVTISGTAPGGTAGGDLSGTYPNPTVAKINGTLLGTTATTIGTLLAGTGSNIASVALSGDATIGGTGVLTVSAGAITGGKIATGTVTAANLAAGDFSSKINSGTYSINISGNAATVTNGVYTNAANTIIPASGVALSLKAFASNHILDLYNGAGISSYFDSAGLFNGSGAGITSGTIANGALANNSIALSYGTGASGSASVALGGTLTINNTGVTSAIGTANQVNVSSASGAVTFSLPQSIATTSSPTFAGLTAATVNATTALQVNGTNVCTSSGCTAASGSGSYIQNGATQQASSNFNISGSGTAATLNATSGIQLNGANINTAGILTNVAYLNQSNSFSGPVTVISTTSPQLTLKYDGSNYFTTGISSTGTVAFVAQGTGAGFTFNSGIVANGGISSPGSASLSEKFGQGSSAAGESVAVGRNANASSQDSVAVGYNSITVVDSVAIGAFASSGTGSIAIGCGAASTASNQLILGGNCNSGTGQIQNAYFGSGVTSASPGDITIQGTGGSGTNVAGANVTLAAGKGTGSAAGGDVIIATAPAGTTGGTLNSLVERLRVTAAGNTAITGNLSVSGTISGTVGDTNLSSNVALLNRTGQTFTGTDTFSGTLTTNGINNTGAISTSSLAVTGNATVGGTLAVTGAVTGGTYNTAAISGGSLTGTTVDGLGVSANTITTASGNLNLQAASGIYALNTAGVNNELRVYDSSGAYYASLTNNGTNTVLSSNTGEVQIGGAGSNQVIIGDVGSASNLVFQENSAIVGASGGRTITLGASGDTFNLNTAGVTYNIGTLSATNAVLNTSSTSNTALIVNGPSSLASNLLDLQVNGSSQLSVSSGGALTLASTINGQTISSAANLTGTLTVAGLVTNTTSGTTAEALTGAPGASATASLVQLGSAIASGNASGTFLSINGASGYSGDLLNLQVNGTSELKVASTGALTLATALTVPNGGTGLTTIPTSSILIGNGASAVSTLAAGSNGQCLVIAGGVPTYGSCAGTGSGSTLQAAYNNGNTISTTAGNDLSITLANNANALFNIPTSQTGKFAIQGNGADVFAATSGAVISYKPLTVSASSGGLGNQLTVSDTTTQNTGILITSSLGSSGIRNGTEGLLLSGLNGVVAFSGGGSARFAISPGLNTGNVSLQATGTSPSINTTNNFGIGSANTNPQLALTIGSANSFGIEMSAPGTITATPSTTGGTFSAGTYYYEVTASDGTGQTIGSTQASCTTTGTTGSCALSWAAITGAASYNVYRSTTSNTYGATSLASNVTTNAFTDTNAALASGTVPVVTTAYVVKETNGLAVFRGGISSPGSLSGSERFGNSSSAGTNGTALGSSASAGTGSVAIGNLASSSDIAIGGNASAGNIGIAIGGRSNANNLRSIALGDDAITTASNQLVIGGSGPSAFSIQNAFIGNGVTSATPMGFTLQGTGGSGSNVQGATVTIAAGQGTGSATSGDLILQTAGAGTAGSSLNALQDRLHILANGNVGIGNSNPGSKLTVSGGGIQLDNNQGIFSKDSSGTILGYPLLLLDSGNNYSARNPASTGNAYYGTYNGSNTAGSIYFQTNGAQQLSINPSGGVSINSAGSLANGKLDVVGTATGTPNYGLVNVGSGAFNGSTAGYFQGSSSGTQLAVNATSGFSGNLVDLQVAGSSKFKVNVNGSLSISGTQVCTSAGCTSSAGSGSYIQNGTAQQASSNFNISGSGTVGSGLSVAGGESVTGGSSISGGLSVTGNTTLSGNLLASGSQNIGSSGTPFTNGYFGNLSATGTINGGTLSSTAVNGVVTANILQSTGSYADPSWLTSLSGAKITGAIADSTLSSNVALYDVSSRSWQSSSAKNASRYWKSVAMSSDGTRQTAVALLGQIYVSTDSGSTWIAKDSSRFWSGVAMSADGTRQTAVEQGGYIYISTDSGNTWTAKDSSRSWSSVAMSVDGTRQTAVVSGGQIYVSTDSGSTWIAKDSNRSWKDVAMSADGTRQTAVVQNGYIYVSTDSGSTWTSEAPSLAWSAVAMSSNGSRQTAVEASGNIYTSSDYGVTWTGTSVAINMSTIAVSSDGRVETAAAYGGQIYVSADYGATWNAKDSSRSWNDVAMSADGTKQTAAASSDYLYVSNIDTSFKQSLNVATTAGNTSNLLTLANGGATQLSIGYNGTLTTVGNASIAGTIQGGSGRFDGGIGVGTAPNSLQGLATNITSAAGNVYGVYNSVSSTAVNPTVRLYGTFNNVTIPDGASVNTAYGSYSTVSNTSTTSNSTLYGSVQNVLPSANDYSAFGNYIGVSPQAQTNYGTYIRGSGTSGGGSYYALYANNTATGLFDNYGLYVRGATSGNYLQNNLFVGSASNTGGELSVTASSTQAQFYNTTNGSLAVSVSNGGSTVLTVAGSSPSLDIQGGSLTVAGSEVCTTSTGCGATAGSSSYIQNGTTQQASSNFNISGSGTVGGAFSAASVSATSTIASTASATAFQASATPTGSAQLVQLGSVLGSPSSSGTFIGANASTGFSGNFVDYQVNGVSKYKIDASGTLTTSGTLTIAGTGTSTFAGTIQVAELTSAGALSISSASNGSISIAPDGSGNINATLTTGKFTVGDGGTTNYAQFDQNGALSFTGAARPYSELTLIPNDALTPASANCTVNQTNDSNGTSYKTLDCPTGSDASGSWQFKMPQNYVNATNIQVDVYWEDTTSSSTNTARFDVGYVSVPSGSTFAGSTRTDVTGSTQASAGQNVENDSTITVATPTISANDLVSLRVLRKGTVDSLPDTAKILQVRVKYLVNS